MTQPYGSWPSSLSNRELTRGIKGFADLQCAAGELFLLESRPEESGRTTLLMVSPKATVSGKTQTPIELTPAPLNVRSRVHEYGGGSFLATEHAVFVVNFADQNLFRIPLQHTPEGIEPGPAEQLTQGDADRRYADFALDEMHNRLIAVCEIHKPHSHEPQNLLVAIDLAAPAAGAEARTETILHEGHDFYAEPRISTDGHTLAFVTWDHPDMPWDATVVHCATLEPAGLQNIRAVAGGRSESVCQLLWHSATELGFASDRNGFWNRCSVDTANTSPAATYQCLHADEAEYASPQWVFGLRQTITCGGSTSNNNDDANDNDKLIAVRQPAGAPELVYIELADGSRRTLFAGSYAGYHALVNNRRVPVLHRRSAGWLCLSA